MEDTLGALRKQIDGLDKQIVELIAKRMDVVHQVGAYKKANNIPPLDESRWNAVLQEKIALAKSLGIDTSLVADIFNRIHEAALDVEDQV